MNIYKIDVSFILFFLFFIYENLYNIDNLYLVTCKNFSNNTS